MTRIVEHIEYLIERNDCVVIPRVGALLRRYQSAECDDKGNIRPPHFEISFNGAITHDDGLIASSIARREGRGYSEAASVLASEIDVLRLQLDSDGIYQLGSVGELRKDGENCISFTPAAFSPLKTLVAPTTAKPEERVVDDLLETTKSTVYLSISRFTHVASRVAAVIALALILGFCIYRPMTMGDGVMKASFLPQLRGNITEKCDIAETQSDDSVVVVAEEIADVVDHECDENIQLDNEVSKETNDYTYYLIVASLATEELAADFIENESQTDFIVLAVDGRYRVAAKGGMSYAEVYDSRLLACYPDAWVYKR